MEAVSKEENTIFLVKALPKPLQFIETMSIFFKGSDQKFKVQ